MSNLYTKYKVFHFPEKIKSLPAASPEIQPPIHVRLKPTNVCNHSCWYCAYRFDELQLGQDMVVKDSIPRERMLQLVDELEDLGVQSVTFSGGGEPFAYKHILETVNKLAAGPIQFASLTNGSLLRGEVAEVFANAGTWVRVSIDGWDDPSYAKYRSTREGAFTRVLTNLRDFKAHQGPCRLGASLIIDQDNCSHVYELASKLRDTGIDSLKLSPCIVSNEGEANNRYHSEIYGEARRQVDKVRELASERFEVFDSYHLLEEKFSKDYSWCPYLQVLVVIGADLNVYSCQDKAYNLDSGLLGSIKDVSFKDFWYSDKNRFFSIDPSKSCDHHCVSNAKNQMLLEFLDAAPQHLGFV